MGEYIQTLTFEQARRIETFYGLPNNYRWGRAYAVSKKGEIRLIADFLDEPEKLQEYLQVMSNHFKERGL